MATNQSGIARGYYDLATLESMHARLRQLVAEQGGEVGLIVHCPHGPDDGCECRKPKPGMLRQIAAHYATDLAGIWFVGDTSGDLQAALAVDCQPVLVKTGRANAPWPSHCRQEPWYSMIWRLSPINCSHKV